MLGETATPTEFATSKAQKNLLPLQFIFPKVDLFEHFPLLFLFKRALLPKKGGVHPHIPPRSAPEYMLSLQETATAGHASIATGYFFAESIGFTHLLFTE